MRAAPFALALAVLLVPACGGHREYLGRTANGREPNGIERNALMRAGVDLQCGPDELVVQPIGASAYRVDGCGRAITYLCVTMPGRWGRDVACTPSQVAQPALGGIVYAQPVVTTTAAPPPPQAPPQAIVPPGPEVAAARAAIDSHAAGVLACNGGVAVAVDATWNAAGALTVNVVGHPGTPEEECVRASLSGTTVSPAGAGGHVMHAVEPH
jgi:hypothetical protein